MIKLLGFASLCSSSLGYFCLWDDLRHYLWGDLRHYLCSDIFLPVGWLPQQDPRRGADLNATKKKIFWYHCSTLEPRYHDHWLCHHYPQDPQHPQQYATIPFSTSTGKNSTRWPDCSWNLGKHCKRWYSWVLMQTNMMMVMISRTTTIKIQNSTENNSMAMATKKIISAKISTMCRMRIEDQLAVESPRLGGWWGWACSHMSNAWEPIPHNVTHPQTLVGTVRAQPAPNGSLIVFSSSSSIHSYGDCSLYLHDDSPSWS